MRLSIPTDLRRSFEDRITRGIFNPVARLLPEHVREDRPQDAIAQTWAMYERYAERGELLDDAILVHSCGPRATDASRYYVPCNGYQRKCDVFDPRNFMEGRIEVLRFGDFDDEDEHRGPDEDEAPVGFGLAEATSSNPTRRILSAINLTAWLADLPADDRRMLELRAAGFDLEEISGEIGSSMFAICRRIEELGENLARHACLPDAVRRGQSKRMAIHEDAQPDSRVRRRVRGRPDKSQVPISSTRGMPTRRMRRAA
ncbi:hypothetical protein [Sorangium sp. So ce426]|uniref:hypothetical protein n=1 Tax=Sorangium sp. So ce426 TaxID=3133312 RepID=UPI003F5B9565